MTESEVAVQTINLVLQGALVGITLGFLHAFFGKVKK